MAQEVENSDSWLARVRRVAKGTRLRALEQTIRCNGGYLSQACSSAEILATLFSGVMRLGPSVAPLIPPPFQAAPGPHNPQQVVGADYYGLKRSDLDRFVISPTHYSLAVYAALVEVGRLAPEGLGQFNQDGSSVEMIGSELSPGIELTSGSFGQALSQAAGMAVGRRLRGDTGRTWVFMSDGELQEGQTWEAFQAMAFYKVDTVVVYIDVNGQQVDGRMVDVMNVEPIRPKLEAFGARVFRIDGHEIEMLTAPVSLEPDGRPTVVLAYTNPAQGIELLEARKPLLHFVGFKSAAERAAYQSFFEQMRASLEM